MRAEGSAGAEAARADPRPLVLLVEDDARVAQVVARLLEPAVRVAFAGDGVVGLAKALELRPDLVLTDMMMPRMTGEQLLAEIRRRRELDDTPVIVLTAFADDELRVRMLREGAIDYVTKPFSPEELLSRVENAVALKRARELLQVELRSRTRDLEALAAELVTRKRELESALESAEIARDRAEAASRAKSAFLGLVTHELMTPVTALRLGLQRLLRERSSPLPEPHRAALDRLVRVTGRLGSAIESLLEHARYEGGRLSVRQDPVDVRALAREVLDELRPQADDKGLALRLSAEVDDPIVLGDRRLLRIVIANLASNAVKFTDRGAVTVQLLRQRGELRVVVEDSGPGIPERDRERIFEPFQQLSPLAHKHLPGIGLGLALAREMTEALRGTIAVDAGERGGSRFVVTLPA